MRNTAKKAFTIAELTIVLALITIVSGMVISFSTLVDKRKDSAQANLDLISDINNARVTLTNWLDVMSRKDSILCLGEIDGNTDNTTLIAKVDAEQYEVKMREDYLGLQIIGASGERNDFKLNLSCVFQMCFDVYGTEEQMLFVTIICNVGKKQVSYTFTVRSHIGSVV